MAQPDRPGFCPNFPHTTECCLLDDELDILSREPDTEIEAWEMDQWQIHGKPRGLSLRQWLAVARVSDYDSALLARLERHEISLMEAVKIVDAAEAASGRCHKFPHSEKCCLLEDERDYAENPKTPERAGWARWGKLAGVSLGEWLATVRVKEFDEALFMKVESGEISLVRAEEIMNGAGE